MGKVKLESICTIVSGSTPQSSCPEYWGGSIKWVTPAEISDETHYIKDTERHITEEGMRSCHLRMMPSGTVLLSSRAPIGKTAITKSAMCCNQGFKNLICGNSISNEYLYYFLKSKTDELKSIGRGATFKEISKKQVESITINLPALDEQNRRTAALGQIDMLLKQNRKLTGIIDDLVKSRFVEMFGEAEKPRKDFPVKALNDVCSSIVRGPFGSAMKKEFFVPQGANTYKVYEQKHAIQKRADIGAYYITRDRFETLKRFECFPGDILMSCSGTMGEFYQLPPSCEPGVMNQALCKFTLSEAILSDYFLGFMEQVVDELGAKGSGIKNVSSVKYIKAIRIPLPPLELQRQFADFVTQVDKLRFEAQQQIEKLETLKKSLMQEYFG